MATETASSANLSELELKVFTATGTEHVEARADDGWTVISGGWNYPNIWGDNEAVKSSRRSDDGQGWIVEFHQVERTDTTMIEEYAREQPGQMSETIDLTPKKRKLPEYTVYAYAVRNNG
ncbi:hypothetical protein [Streptomyces sp. NPDC051183]|uniref:hypothetical protein n=1 Tax=Streptomyces sp. NPDC051183 TaxID=3155165 RepID=UPI0034146286